MPAPSLAMAQIRFEGVWSSLIGVIVGMLVWGGGCPARALGAPQPGTAASDTTAPVVRSVEIQGNQQFSDQTLKRNLRTQPNRRILGIPGLTWWRWVYQLGNSDWMWSRLGDALKSGGEPPARLDSSTVVGDTERLRLFYRQQGFREATISYRVETPPSADWVRVTFSVEPGPTTYIRQVQYTGLDVLTRRQQRRLAQQTVFEPASSTIGDTLRFALQGQRYREPLLLEQRRRILTFLQNEGYAGASPDSIRAIVDSVVSDSFDVTFRVQTGPRYRFGSIRFVVKGTETTPSRTDTLSATVDSSGGYQPLTTARITDESHLNSGILRRSLQFSPGEYHDQSAIQATKRRLESTGVFTFTSLSPEFGEVVRDSAGTRYLPLRIRGRTRQRHRVRAETFALQRESVGSAETSLQLNEFGVGLSGLYENINALGGGETFRLRASGSVASGLDSTLVSSRQLEVSGSLTFPYLIRPFRPFEQLFDLSSTQTRVSLSVLTARRNKLGLRIRSRVNAQLQLEMRHTPTRVSRLDVMDLSLSNPDTLDQFGTRFLNRVFGPEGGGVQNPVQRQQILQDYTRPQINTALRYTFRSATANLLRRRNGHIYELSTEVGSTLPLLFDRFVFAPATLNYSLPGFFGGTGGLTGRLLYRPYLRTTVDLRRYVPLGSGTTVATKLFGGLAHPTAGPTVVPFDRRFFSGGASSVRGWRLWDLGPGATRLPADTTAAAQGGLANILGGDLKLESSIELRTTLVPSLLAARWTGATFLDMGNVWFGPRNPGLGNDEASSDSTMQTRLTMGEQVDVGSGRFQGLESLLDVGVGGGIGLRLEWKYLVVRFDLAYRLHDPSPANDDVFSDDSGGPLLHFGIGQAF